MTEVSALTTATLYRPVGTAELVLIKAAAWRAFPQMPAGHAFFAFTQPTSDVLLWHEQLQGKYWIPETGQQEIVASWDAWGNAQGRAFILSFEIDVRSSLLRHGWHDRPYVVDQINAALIGTIDVFEELGPL